MALPVLRVVYGPTNLLLGNIPKIHAQYSGTTGVFDDNPLSMLFLSGVPLGSIVGHLLLLLFINDLDPFLTYNCQ